ncbi:surf-like protein [Orbilia brochopaga]|uniref:SURF1-like protein n=1 Tax=Orbilia brochopaga TaxID=3140254 RepID=A0AAV9V2X9_9PEZI
MALLLLLRRRAAICPSCSRRLLHPLRRLSSQPGDSPAFTSPLDLPPRLVRTNRRHRPLGLFILALIPLTAFALGTWQIQRLNWKTALLARCEDNLSRPPLPLPPALDISQLPAFDYRRVVTRGVFQHDREILLGPRLHDGVNGYIVITPLDRSLDGGSTILVNRGWISKELADRRKRLRVGGEAALPSGEVLVEGLLREQGKRNMFTPENKPEKGEWYFPDIHEMATWVAGCGDGNSRVQDVLIEETSENTILGMMGREARGIPIGREAAVNIRNNHFQYIVTWYSLGLATSFMFYMLVRRPPREITRKVRLQKDWA